MIYHNREFPTVPVFRHSYYFDNTIQQNAQCCVYRAQNTTNLHMEECAAAKKKIIK